MLLPFDQAGIMEKSPGYNAERNIELSGYRDHNFASRYDQYRPSPPAALMDLLLRIAGSKRPELVVDLGSGTGHSTYLWAGRARLVIGIEPNDEMRWLAESRGVVPNVHFHTGYSHATGLPAGCADIVTCSQSLHWMEPASTFSEVHAILRSGGVFAAYDYDWPPAINWELEKAVLQVHQRIRLIAADRQLERRDHWPKEGHLQRMQESGHFRYTRELLLHNTEIGTAERLIGHMLSLGVVAQLLYAGLSEEEIGLDELRSVAERTIGSASLPWHFSYRVRVGVK